MAWPRPVGRVLGAERSTDAAPAAVFGDQRREIGRDQRHSQSEQSDKGVDKGPGACERDARAPPP
jgi:hypothetical protein